MIRFLDELSDLEKLSLMPMSYSRLNTYDMCNAKYFFSYIAKQPSQYGEAALLGNLVHAVLENKLQADKEIVAEDADSFMLELENQKPIVDPNDIVGDEFMELGRQLLVDFIDRHVGQEWPIYSKEMPFEVVLGPALFRGFIDRVDVYKNKVCITDYKTGKHEVAQKNVAKDLQLGIYALIMERLFPGKEIYAELYYLRTARQKGHLFTRDDLSAVEDRLLELVNKILSQRWFSYTDQPRVCSFCDHAESGICNFGSRYYRRRH